MCRTRGHPRHLITQFKMSKSVIKYPLCSLKTGLVNELNRRKKARHEFQ
ncbi:unnamed protein product [Larinioides sclopetarius]|uniref:Uncharacterized protein n=1 Tax=Larinioides sclopetarius TaxID=280406 RepID=A0AAV2BDS4_9ARAC